MYLSWWWIIIPVVIRILYVRAADARYDRERMKKDLAKWKEIEDANPNPEA